MGKSAKTGQKRSLEEMSASLIATVWLYRLLMVAFLALGICIFDALTISLSATLQIVLLLGYAVLQYLLQKTYRACEIGQWRVSDLTISQTLSNVISAAAVYGCAVLYAHTILAPWRLLAVVVAQVLVGMGWTVIANRLYFKRRRKSRTVVFCQNEEELILLRQTPYFDVKYNVLRVVYAPDEDMQRLRASLEGCDTAFVVNISSSIDNTIAKLCLEMDVKGYFTPRLGHIIMAGAQHRANFSIPLFRVERADGQSEYRALKRVFDVAASAVAVVVLSPVMVAIALAVWLEDRGPVFYRQTRLTRNGKEFTILKFRSMTIHAEEDGIARLAGEHDSRITRIGRFLRACHMDELPQLFNILRGDMSIVGPRPERPEIARQYEELLPEFTLRLQVKAGLTGLAQVYGRYNTEPYYKLQMDLMYINEMSLLTDLQLITATIKILFDKENAQGFDAAQMQPRYDDSWSA